MQLPLAQMMEVAELGYLIIDELGIVRKINEQLLSDLGYEREESKDLSILEVNPVLTFLEWKRFWKKLQPNQIIEENAEFITKDGVIYPVKTKAYPVFFSGAKFTCITVFNQLEENRYKDLLDLTAKVSKICSWEYDLVKQEIFLSRGFFNLIGELDKEEKLYTPWNLLRVLRTVVTRDELRKILNAIRCTIESGKSLDLETRMSLPERSASSFKITGTPLYLEEQTAKIFGVVQDISSISLRSEEMYLAQYTIEHSKEMIFWIRADGSFYYTNKKASEIFGYTSEELAQLNVTDLNPFQPKEDWSAYWSKVQREGYVEVETVNQTKSGEHIPLEFRASIFDYQGEILMCVFGRDLRFKKQRDELIDLGHQTLDHSKDIFFWALRDGTIIYYNRAAYEQLGYAESEFAHLNIYDLARDLTEEESDGFWQQLMTDNYLEFEHTAYRKNGEHFPIRVRVTRMEYQGQGCACIVWQDISKSQERLQKLESAYEEINQLKDKIEQEKNYFQAEVTEAYNFNNIISASKNYQIVLDQVAQVADTSTTVLIQGETGTGKELLARAIHGFSSRNDKPFIKVNCTALPPNLIESELFGHEKGAFTGAHQTKKGRFELADKATLFLDEIGEMPLELQPKLLRVLQEGEFTRVGGNQTIKVDVRIIAATNRNLKKQVHKQKFREDLFYRLNVFPIYNLPLRERKDDIPLLLQHFMKKYSDEARKNVEKVLEKDLKELMRYEFPGNIRELENLVERAVVLSKGKVLNLSAILPQMAKNASYSDKRFPSFEEMQKQHIIKALKRTNWKVTGENSAAKLLNINGKTLASKMRKLGIRREDFMNN